MGCSVSDTHPHRKHKIEKCSFCSKMCEFVLVSVLPTRYHSCPQSFQSIIRLTLDMGIVSSKLPGAVTSFEINIRLLFTIGAPEQVGIMLNNRQIF